MRKNKKSFNIIRTVLLGFLLLAVLAGAFYSVRRRLQMQAPQRSEDTESPVSAQEILVPISVPEESASPEIEMTVRISELMPSNKATIADDTGHFPDWIELVNTGTEILDLSGCSLRCDGDSINLDGIMIGPGSYYALYCPAKLSASGGTAVLADGKGKQLSYVTYDACAADISVIIAEDDSVEYTAFPTPGFPNSDEGYEAWQASLSPAGPLVINEVMVYNDSLLRINNQYYDWVEIRNISSQQVMLSDYYLSDSNSDRMQYQLPEKSLAPGDVYTIYCTGEAEAANRDFAPFAFNAQWDKLFLSASDGTLLDYASLHDIPLGGSFGRSNGQNGFFYFPSPSPSFGGNPDGFRCIARKPVSSEPDGVFNDVESVTVSLSAPGTIYYTTNGDTPTTGSTPYTGPISLSSTTVIRAISYEPGKLTAEPLSLSYIINEQHTVPVVSLITDENNFNSVYYNPLADIERPGTIEYFGEDGSFALDCGFKLHGETSRMAQKKSFKITFRSRYDGPLQYDLFNNGITEFASILLRSAQESTYSSLMRDNLIHQLAIAAFPELPSQDYRYSVLYVNGKYWGVYNIREAHSKNHYAAHYGYDPNTVLMTREDYPNTNEYMTELMRYITSHNLSNSADYDYVASHLNVDSVIGWSILQAYSGNIDCYPNNIRLYYSPQDEMLRYALLDLDLGFFGFDAFSIAFSTEYRFTNIARTLLNNPVYRKEFLEQMSAALTGPLANENVLSLIDQFESEITDEMYRDRTRWGGTYTGWQALVQELRTYVTQNNGRARAICNSLRSFLYMTDAEYQEYFGNVK